MKQVDKTERDIVEAALDALRPDDDGRGILDPLDELSERRMAERIVQQYADGEGRTRVLKRPVRWVAAAGILAAATLTYWMIDRAPAPSPAFDRVAPIDPAPAVAKRQTHIPGSQFALLFGDVRSDDGTIAMGAEIPVAERIRTGDGQAALSLPTGIAAGLAKNTSVRVLWSGNTHFGVSLLSGMALFSVDPIQTRDRFFVDTPAGTIHVTGTLFSVVVSPQGDVFVKRHLGSLRVERSNGETIAITDGALVQLNGHPSGSGAPAINEQMLSQLQAFRCMDRGDLFTELAHFECLGLQAGAAASKSPAPPQRAAGPEARETVPSIKALMSRARQQKASGDWPGAADAYRTLIRLYPDADEARTSMVSLGQIQLNHLGNVNGALKLFGRYLNRPGPLAQEALFGKAEAYRALGDRSMEEKTLAEFLSRFPRGLYAQSVSGRLDHLRSAASDR